MKFVFLARAFARNQSLQHDLKSDLEEFENSETCEIL
jgi:hypothetical protein